MTKRTLFQTLLAGIVGVKVDPAVIQAAPVLDPAFKVGGDVTMLHWADLSGNGRNLYWGRIASGEFPKSVNEYFPKKP